MKRILLMTAIIGLLFMGMGRVAGSADYSLKRSRVWYAPIIQQNFPSQVRVCGFETQIDGFNLYPKDITKFRAVSKVATSQGLLALKIGGSVAFGPLSAPFKASKENKNRFAMYIEAFLFSPDGRLYDVQSFSKEGGNWVSLKGGKVNFSIILGKGYDFDRGGWALLIASGEPLSVGSSEAECVVIGAKKITLG